MSSGEKRPVVFGRLATEEDFISGVAVFHQGGSGSAYADQPLPAYATACIDNDEPRKVLVVQMERQPDGFDICGALDINGLAIVCSLDELQFQGDVQ